MRRDPCHSCEVRRGLGRVLLVAPHGGRRPAIDPLAPPANLRVNDVYTPEVTLALAQRLDAGAIVNHAIDRNQIDLNRTNQILRRAPWFLDILREEVDTILKRHERAEVVFVHGWNNGQLKCDIGVGGRESAGAILAPEGRELSVGPEYLLGRVHHLRRALVARGIRAPIGEKYPASHPSNLVQLFTPPTGHLASAERVDAMQLELSLPLRCPGRWRDRFLDAALEGFGTDEPRAAAADATVVGGDAGPSTPESLQFYDPAAGLGVFAGIGRMGPRSSGGRLLLFLGGQRIALFTGEEVGAGAVPPLSFTREGSRVAMRFRGPILVLEDAAVYLDLEAALAASVAVDADVAVDFEELGHAPGSATLGRAAGHVTIDGERRAIGTLGFGHVAGLRAASSGQTMLAATFATRQALVTRMGHGDRAAAVWFEREAAEPLHDLHLEVIEDGDAFTPAAFEIDLRGRGRLRALPLNRMAILRSGPLGYVRVSFGVARVIGSGLEGFGLYEHALPLAPATRS